MDEECLSREIAAIRIVSTNILGLAVQARLNPRSRRKLEKIRSGYIDAVDRLAKAVSEGVCDGDALARVEEYIRNTGAYSDYVKYSSALKARVRGFYGSDDEEGEDFLDSALKLYNEARKSIEEVLASGEDS